MDSNLLIDYGIDYDKGLNNCMGNLSFYKKIMSMFLEDKCFANSKLAYEEQNNTELFNRMHEMKGISGNIALVKLYSNTVLLVEYLRCGGNVREEIDKMFADVQASYELACEGIAIVIAEQ